MNPEDIVGEEGHTYLDHRQKGADGAKNGLGWRDARDLLREIHGLDGGVQQREDTIVPFRSLGIRIYGRNSR